MKKVRSLVLAHAKNQWCQKCNSSTLTDGCVETVHLGHALHQWDASEEGGGDVGGDVALRVYGDHRWLIWVDPGRASRHIC